MTLALISFTLSCNSSNAYSTAASSVAITTTTAATTVCIACINLCLGIILRFCLCFCDTSLATGLNRVLSKCFRVTLTSISFGMNLNQILSLRGYYNRLKFLLTNILGTDG